MIAGPGFSGIRVPVEYIDGAGNVVSFTDGNGFTRIEYRDEYPGDDWSTPQGAGSTPSVANVTIGGLLYRTRQFAGNAENQMSNKFEIPHDMDIDRVNAGLVAVEFHDHFTPTTNDAGVVKWFFDWMYAPVSNGSPLPPLAMSTLSFLQTISVNTQHHHYVAGVELPIPAGGYNIGDIIRFNIRRTPADAQDTYNAPVIFDKCALHVPINSMGSRQRYIK